MRVEPCARDDRKKIPLRTDKGKEGPGVSGPGHLRGPEPRLFRLSPEELATLDRLQKKMLQNLSALTQNHSKEVSKS